MTPGVLILTGQTASGKSALALALAERFGAEIVGADSRQIYRGMAVGTAAPSHADLARAPHHLVGFLDPRERYSAARFVRDALAAVDDVHARGKRAIVVGGTGFYVRALAGDVTLSPAYDAELRERLAREARVHPPGVLADWLRALAPQRAAAIAANDPYRIMRALEVALVERLAAGRPVIARCGLATTASCRAKTFARAGFPIASSISTSIPRCWNGASPRASTTCWRTGFSPRPNASGPVRLPPMRSDTVRRSHFSRVIRRLTGCART